MMDIWQPIVFTRTFEVDYRFLGVPETFDDVTQDAARPFINGALSGSDFREQVRWAAFCAGGRFILGCAGTVATLLGSTEFALDRHRRTVYAFVGVVAQRRLPAHLPSPSELLPILRRALESELRENWPLPFQKPPHRYGEELQLPGEPCPSPERSAAGRAGIVIWPDEGTDNWELIRAVAADDRRSCCIGVQQESNLYDGEGRLYPFTDFIITGRDRKSLLQPAELPLPPERPAPPPYQPPSRFDKAPASDRPSIGWIPLTIGAGVVGALVWVASKSYLLLLCSAATAGAGLYALGRSLARRESPPNMPQESRRDQPARPVPPLPGTPRERKGSPWV